MPSDLDLPRAANFDEVHLQSLPDGDLLKLRDQVKLKLKQLNKQIDEWQLGARQGPQFDEGWYARLRDARGYTRNEFERVRIELRHRGLLTPQTPMNQDSNTGARRRLAALQEAIQKTLSEEVADEVMEAAREIFEEMMAKLQRNREARGFVTTDV